MIDNIRGGEDEWSGCFGCKNFSSKECEMIVCSNGYGHYDLIPNINFLMNVLFDISCIKMMQMVMFMTE